MIQNESLFPGENGRVGCGPVECLGHSFASDGERREHFCQLLREKLKDPSFRSLDGFPLGEDEDILALSDPPYYTACPNPWLAEFAEGGGRPSDSDLAEYRREPFATDVSEGKNDPVYNAHSYHTKVPYKAIVRYILHYTEPGDLVYDGFCGTGMAGVAAQLCGDRQTVESLGYTVDASGTILDENGLVVSRLGARRAILNDLSPAATFIAYNYNTPLDADRFRLAAEQLLDNVEANCGWMYLTLHDPTDEQIREAMTLLDSPSADLAERNPSLPWAKINFTVWSDVFACPTCGCEIVFFDEAFDHSTGRVRDEFPCPRCSAVVDKASLQLLYESYVDSPSGAASERPRRVPVWLEYEKGKTRSQRAVNEFDVRLAAMAGSDDWWKGVPTLELPDMQMARVGRMRTTRVSRIHHFFLPRQARSLACLWAAADEQDDSRTRDMLKFTVEQGFWGMSVLNRYRPIQFGRLGGSQVNQHLTGVFYVASLIAEASPAYYYRGKIKRLAKVTGELWTRTRGSMISTSSASQQPLPSDSVDYLFSDPPFGENIYYSDLNLLTEAWHGVVTQPAAEAIVDRVRGKGLADYQSLMQSCFDEYARVLKPGRWITVEFHNSQNAVWAAIQEALSSSGLVVADVRTLDKKQGSYQQVMSGGAVKQDLVISAYKPRVDTQRRFTLEAGTPQGAWSFARGHLGQLPVAVQQGDALEIVAERQAYLLYDRMVAFHVQRGASVPLSAAEFYAGLEQRFACRDSMYFLPEQVAEYDKKRLQAQQVRQLELFVTDEASAIQWLRQTLLEKPMSFQDVHPLFMREIAGWEKHERPLELAELLEENFVRYDGTGEVPSQVHSYLSSNFHEMRGLDKSDPLLRARAKDRWYVPDPRKAGDLEQLRERTLLREFDEYAVGKGKLKLFRVEAVRTGFKRAWQEHDYAAIISVAERLPADVLQEDAKLLMWYDQALTRAGE